jgi:hypothetical protein
MIKAALSGTKGGGRGMLLIARVTGGWLGLLALSLLEAPHAVTMTVATVT